MPAAQHLVPHVRAEQGAVALVVSNSEPIVVPHGGKESLLGTNPIAFAAPAVVVYTAESPPAEAACTAVNFTDSAPVICHDDNTPRTLCGSL